MGKKEKTIQYNTAIQALIIITIVTKEHSNQKDQLISYKFYPRRQYLINEQMKILNKSKSACVSKYN